MTNNISQSHAIFQCLKTIVYDIIIYKMILLNQLPLNLQEQNLPAHNKVNLQAITLWPNEKYFILEPNYKKSLISTRLKINRLTGQIVELNQKQSIKKQKPHYFSLLLGIINLNNHKILALVQQAKLVCTIYKRDIFKIIKPVFIFFEKGLKLTQQQRNKIEIITNILMEGMYFSYSYDLTLTINHQEFNQSTTKNFNWILNIQKDLLNFNRKWIVPVIQGFIGKFEIYIQGKKLTFILISRRSNKMGGTRYLSRGINPDGDVANFVQTQQIIIYDQYIFSYLQIRGSIPLFWKNTEEYGGLIKDIKMIKSFKQNKQTCLNHIKKIEVSYGDISIVNLLQQNKKNEAKLIQCFETIIKSIGQRKTLHYFYLDIKKFKGIKRTEYINNYLEQNLLKKLQQHKFYCFLIDQNNQIKEVKQKQTGIFRTNCLDCVQRTGIIQSKLSALNLIYVFKHLKINLVQDKKTSLEMFQDPSHPLVQLFRNLWADNADYISQQYTGTGSIHSYSARTGKSSIIQPLDYGIKSIMRTVNDVGKYDQYKQKVIQILLGTDQHMIETNELME